MRSIAYEYSFADILIYRDIEMPNFPLPYFHVSNCVLFTLVPSFSTDVILRLLISFYGLAGITHPDITNPDNSNLHNPHPDITHLGHNPPCHYWTH